MRRGAIVGAAVVALLVWMSGDLDACGDKFVRVGHSARLRHYAAIHRASILVYESANAKADAVLEFQQMLTRAGHSPVFVSHGTNIARAAAAGEYDLVIANLGDVPQIREQLRSVADRPDVVPLVAVKLSKAVEAVLEKEYHSIIAPFRMTKFDALEELDHAMAIRLRNKPASRSARK